MEQRALVCIGCPLGCPLEVVIESSQVVSVTGHSCQKGAEYAVKECTDPTRILTTTVVVKNGCTEVIPVKTEKAISKYKLVDCIRELKQVTLTAPVHIGDIVLSDIACTGVKVIATANCSIRDIL